MDRQLRFRSPVLPSVGSFRPCPGSPSSSTHHRRVSSIPPGTSSPSPSGPASLQAQWVDLKTRLAKTRPPIRLRHVSLFCSFLFFFLWITADARPHRARPRSASTAGWTSKLHLNSARRGAGHHGQSRPNARCNPFVQRGFLHVNTSSFDENYWSPYEESCPPSQLFSLLRDDVRPMHDANRDKVRYWGDEVNDRVALPWLANKTVAIVGDSLDRGHLRHFCDLLSSDFHPLTNTFLDPSLSTPDSPSWSYNIAADNPLSPAPYQFSSPPKNWPKGMYAEKSEGWKTAGSLLNRPWVCRVHKYNFTLVSLFSYGMDALDDGLLFATVERDFFPPARLPDRIVHVLAPLLDNLAVLYGQPSIASPDLIELSSGPWDARAWTQYDMMDAGKPDWDEWDPLVYLDTKLWQRERWARGARDTIKEVATRWKDAGIMWRSLHQPARSAPLFSLPLSLSVRDVDGGSRRTDKWAPFNKMYQIDELARYTISNLLIEASAFDPAEHSVSYYSTQALNALRHLSSPFTSSPPPSSSTRRRTNRVSPMQRGGKEANKWMEGLGLSKRLRMNEWGTRMTGQSHLFVDTIHPAATPGSILWGDIMLWEYVPRLRVLFLLTKELTIGSDE